MKETRSEGLSAPGGHGQGHLVWGAPRPSQPISIHHSGVSAAGPLGALRNNRRMGTAYGAGAPCAPRMSSSVPTAQFLEELPPLALPPPGIDRSPQPAPATPSSLTTQTIVPEYKYAISCPAICEKWRVEYGATSDPMQSTSPDSSLCPVEEGSGLSGSLGPRGCVQRAGSGGGSLTALSILLVNRSESGEAPLLPSGGKALTPAAGSAGAMDMEEDEEVVVVGGEGGTAYGEHGEHGEPRRQAPPLLASRTTSQEREPLYSYSLSSVDAAMGPFELEDFDDAS